MYLEPIRNSKRMTDRLKENALKYTDAKEGYLMEARITNVRVIDAYAPYYYDEFTCEQKDGTIPPTHGTSFLSKQEAVENFDGAPNIKEMAIRYDPKIAIQIQLDETHSRKNIQFSLLNLESWKPTRTFLHGLHEKKRLSSISTDNPVRILYDQTPDNSSNILLSVDGKIVETSRRLYEGVPEEDKFQTTDEPVPYSDDCSTLTTYLDHLKGAEDEVTEWIETEIESMLLPDPQELPLMVETPTGEAVFTFTEKGRNMFRNISYPAVMETLDVEHPSELSGHTVYIRPHYRKFYDDITVWRTDQCEYTLGVDENKEWEIALTNPNSSENVSASQSITHRLTKSLINVVESISRKKKRLS